MFCTYPFGDPSLRKSMKLELGVMYV